MTVPYVIPPTAVAGQGLPAADWNTKVRDSIESLAKPPRVSVNRTTDQLVGNAAVSTVVWNAEDYDTDNFWSVDTPDRIVIPAGLGGIYLVTFNPIFDIHATGARYATIDKNGVGYGSPVNSGGFAGWYVQHCVTAVVPVVPGDYIRGIVYHSAGVGLNLKGTVYKMSLTATRIGAG